jgi:hypothetical protein
LNNTFHESAKSASMIARPTTNFTLSFAMKGKPASAATTTIAVIVQN